MPIRRPPVTCERLKQRHDDGSSRALSQAIRKGCDWTEGLEAPNPCQIVSRAFTQKSGASVTFNARKGDCPPLPKREPTEAQKAVQNLFGQIATSCKGTKPGDAFRKCVRDGVIRGPEEVPVSKTVDFQDESVLDEHIEKNRVLTPRTSFLPEDPYTSAAPAAATSISTRLSEPPTLRDFQDDIPLSVARAAHQFTSFSPESRGDYERESYARTLRQDFDALSKYADTPEKQAALDVEFARYREGLKRRALDLLHAQSRTASPMITGPARFPTDRNRKRIATEDKRRDELMSFRERALDAIKKTLRPELRPVMTGDTDASERLEAKIAKAERLQEQMKSANAAIRKHAKGGQAAQVAALVALGFSEGNAHRLLTPDYAGRIGFASFELTNNSANIRRMKERLEHVTAVQAMPTIERAPSASGIRLEDAPADNRVRLFFPGKPSEEIRSKLKSRGFRWSPSIGAWQAYRNTSSLALAGEIAGE